MGLLNRRRLSGGECSIWDGKPQFVTNGFPYLTARQAAGGAGGVAACVLPGGVVPGARGAVRRAHATLRAPALCRCRCILGLQHVKIEALLAQQLATAVRLRGGRRQQRGLIGRAGGPPAGGVHQQAEVGACWLLAATVCLPVWLERQPRCRAAP